MDFIFTLRQTGLVKTGAAGPILPALGNEIIVWSYLKTGCLSSKNLIKFKIVQYVEDNEQYLSGYVHSLLGYCTVDHLQCSYSSLLFPSHIMHSHILSVSEVHTLLY